MIEVYKEAVSHNEDCGIERVVELYPAFSQLRLTENICSALFTPNCAPLDYNLARCTSIVSAQMRCSNLTTAVEASSIINALAKAENVAISLRMGDSDALSPQVFDPVKHRIVELSIKYCVLKTTLSKLLLRFNNLLSLYVSECSNLDIRKSYFKVYSRLRTIAFASTTIDNIEPNTFMDLPDLTMFSLAWSITPPFSDSQIAHLQLFHCDCSYAWLRKWLGKNPSLLAARLEMKYIITLVGIMTHLDNTIYSMLSIVQNRFYPKRHGLQARKCIRLTLIVLFRNVLLTFFIMYLNNALSLFYKRLSRGSSRLFFTMRLVTSVLIGRKNH